MQRILGIVLIFLLGFNFVAAQTSFGGAIEDVLFYETTVLVAEGENLLTIPFDGAYHPIERLHLGQKIVQLGQHPLGTYALTEQGVFAISPEGKNILNFAPGGGQSMSLNGDWLVIAAGDGGVRLRQILPDGTLKGAWQIDTPGMAWQTAITDNQLVAVADGGAGVRLYDIADPDHLYTISTLPDISPALKIASTAASLFVADAQNHIHFINAANPANPMVEGHYAPIQAAQKAILSGAWLVIADAQDGLKIYDSQTLRYINGEMNLPTLDIQQIGNWIVAARKDGLHFYDANNLPDLIETAFVPLWAVPTALAINPATNHLVVALGNQGIVIVTLNSFNTLASLSVRGTIIDLEIQNNFAYLILDDGRFLILDIANISAPQVAGITELSGVPQTIHLIGTQAIISAGEAGFYIFDVTDPFFPQRLTLIPSQDFAYDSAQLADGNWVGLDGQQLRVFNPTFTETIEYEAVGKTLAANGQFVVILGENQLANFSAFGGIPTPLTTYTAPRDITDMQIQNNGLILSSNTPNAALIHLDVSNPRHPREASIYSLTEGIKKFTLQNENLLTVSDTLIHWKLNPYKVEWIGEYYPPQQFTALHTFSDELYLLGQSTQTVDGQNLTPLNFSAKAIAHAGNFQAVIDENNRLTIYEGVNPQYTQENITTLTASEQGFWFSQAGGKVFFAPLNTLQPELKINFAGSINALAWHAEKLYIGTHDGQLRAWQHDTFIAELSHLGTVNQITALEDGKIAVAANGLWIFEADLTSPQNIQFSEKVLAVAQHETQLAVANGTCGIRVLDYPTLQEISLYPAGYVSDVAFVEGQLWAIDGGIAVSKDWKSIPVAAPYNPQILNNNYLQWQHTPCMPVTYEVAINGQKIASVNQPFYTIPIQKDMRWQITLVTQNGERISSPEWMIYTNYDGWTQTPQQHNHRLTATDNDFSRLWLLLGVLMIGLGAVGLFNLVRRMLRWEGDIK